jgi:hypothetical protein
MVDQFIKEAFAKVTHVILQNRVLVSYEALAALTISFRFSSTQTTRRRRRRRLAQCHHSS